MSMAVLFQEAKESLDDIFGAGYAAANPLLVDRYVQQAFRSAGHRCESDTTSDNFARTIAPHFAAGLKAGELLPGFPYVQQVNTKELCRKVAEVLGTQVTHGLHAQVGRFMSSAFGGVRRKHYVSDYDRPSFIHMPTYAEAVKIFTTSTGLPS